MKSVLVVGGGAAGLQAANILGQAGFSVTLLEAQNRLGGRMNTIISPHTGAPVELGAEFIHGLVPELWELIRSANLATHEVPDRRWGWQHGRLVQSDGCFEGFQSLINLAEPSAPDVSFYDFLQQHPETPDEVKSFALDYVEGFNAADARQISFKAVAALEKDAEPSSHRTFRISAGYGALIDFMASQCRAHGVTLHLDAPVKAIRWQPGHIEALVTLGGQLKTFQANAALITVPLGVLQNDGPFQVTFEPAIPEKTKAMKRLVMGQAAKITLEFSSRFWPVENFGFLHAPEEAVPTWWSDERSCRLVGWAGGPKAWPLLAEPELLSVAAYRSLAHIFQITEEKLRANGRGSFSRPWHREPGSCGAYSYVAAGGLGAPELLARPVERTLFWAGEATAPDGYQGTVESALASAKRAAHECVILP